MSDRADGRSGPVPEAVPEAAPEELPEIRPPGFLGQRVRRKEDRRLLTGRGRYLADVRIPGTLHAAVFRSPEAHAVITRLDPKAALDIDGVVGVFTAADLEGRVGPFHEGALREISPLLREKVPGMVVKSNPMPVLAAGRVHWVGQPIAVVVASDRYVAEDALERIEAEFDPLESVTDPEAALRPEAPVLHPELGDNVAVHFRVGAGDVDRVFAEAPFTRSERFVMGRQAANAMETRGVMASFDHGRGELSIWVTNARPHLVRTAVSEMLGMPVETVRVVAPDMGGSFGTGLFPEDILIPFLATLLERPVRWIEDRRENLAVTRHARDQIHDLSVAYDSAGRILALRDRYLVDSGAHNPYMITVSYNTAAHLRGQFGIDTFHIECTNVLTNKAPVTPVRGAGRPEAVFAVDRMLDLVAEDLRLDPVEVRRRNLIAAEATPYPMGIPYRDGVDIVYDRSDFRDQLDRALDRFGYREFRARQTEWRRQGRLVGVGVSSYVEGSGYGPHEGAVVRVDATGHVVVHTGAKPHGQGLETTLAQICADQLGVTPDDVTVRAGDTSLIAFGVGTFASRSAATAGSAVGIAAAKLRSKVLTVASLLLGADAWELDIQGGVVARKGAPERTVSLREVAAAAAPGPRSRLPDGMAPGLEEQHYFVPPTVTFGSGTHVVGVEVDEETGFVKVLDYVTVDDCGRMMNPLLVDGQVLGGFAHGIGNALYEEAVYDEQGQLLTGTYMDYLVPTPAEVPAIRVGHQEFESDRNPFGIKGCGEGGAVSPPAAIANAIADALRPLRVHVTRVPLTPERLLRLIQDARREQTGGS